MLSSARDVVRCLITYPDWWQPSSSSILKAGGLKRNKTFGDGLNPRLIETLDERVELCRRMRRLSDTDRHLLHLWYVEQRHVDDIAQRIGVSRRQCFRRKSKALQTIIELGESDRAA